MASRRSTLTFRGSRRRLRRIRFRENWTRDMWLLLVFVVLTVLLLFPWLVRHPIN
jgi:hypothetical protein